MPMTEAEFKDQINRGTQTISEEGKKLFAEKVDVMSRAAYNIYQWVDLIICDIWDYNKYHQKWLNEPECKFLVNRNCKSSTNAKKKVEIWTNLKLAIEPTLEHFKKDNRTDDLYKKLYEVYTKLVKELLNTEYKFEDEISRGTQTISEEGKKLFAEKVDEVSRAAYNIHQWVGLIIYGIWDYEKYYQKWLNEPECKFLVNRNCKSNTDAEKKVEIWTNLKLAIEPTLEHFKQDKRTGDLYKKLYEVYTKLVKELLNKSLAK